MDTNNNNNYGGIPVAPPYCTHRDAEMIENQPKPRHQLKYNHAGKLIKPRSSPGKRVVYYHSLEPEINHNKKPSKKIGNWYKKSSNRKQISETSDQKIIIIYTYIYIIIFI
jgi:hypothetical protein